MSPRISKSSSSDEAKRPKRKNSTLNSSPDRRKFDDRAASAKALTGKITKRAFKIHNPFTNLSPGKKLLLKRVLIWLGVFLVTLVLVDYGVQYLNYKASVAIVNGERLYRKEFYKQLEDSYGSTVVSSMIDEALIYQEADQKNIEVSEKDIDEELTTLEEQYGGKDALQSELDSRNIEMDYLRHQVETTLIVEKILTKQIKVTEDEMKEYYEQYKDSYFTDSASYEDAKDAVKEQLSQEKLSGEYQTWIVGLRNNASIKNNIDDQKDYGFLLITRTFIEDLLNKDSSSKEEPSKK